LATLDPGTIGTVRPNPSLQCEHVDTFLRAGANGRNIDRIDEPWRCAVLELDDGASAMNAWIDADDSHHAPPANASLSCGTGFTPT